MNPRPITKREGLIIVAKAALWLGTRYTYAGTTKKGADCSGSTWSIYGEAGYPYGMIYRPTSQFPMNPSFMEVIHGFPQEGDVAWWPGHVAIYAGEGQIWTAHHTGGPTYSKDALSNWVKRRGSVRWYRYCQ